MKEEWPERMLMCMYVTRTDENHEFATMHSHKMSDSERSLQTLIYWARVIVALGRRIKLNIMLKGRQAIPMPPKICHIHTAGILVCQHILFIWIPNRKFKMGCLSRVLYISKIGVADKKIYRKHWSCIKKYVDVQIDQTIMSESERSVHTQKSKRVQHARQEVKSD